MKTHVLKASDIKWRAYIAHLPAEVRHGFLDPDYCRLYETAASKAECFIVEDGHYLAMYPYLKTSLDAYAGAVGYYDIEGAYGYNGPVFNNDHAGFQGDFAGVFGQFCRREGIIAEFCRINPVSSRYLCGGHLQLRKVNSNVIVPLSLTDEERRALSYEHCVRKNIKKAEQKGVKVRGYYLDELSDGDLGSFTDIYYQTMDRNKSAQEYYFTKDYFLHLCKALGRQGMMYFAGIKGQDVSCELVLMGGNTGYSFLGGTLSEAQESCPNVLLKDYLMTDLREMGLAYYCIGGGRSDNDGIFRYKRNFAKNGVVDFFIGTKVYYPDIYDTLCRNWQVLYPEKQERYGHMFLKYKN